MLTRSKTGERANDNGVVLDIIASWDDERKLEILLPILSKYPLKWGKTIVKEVTAYFQHRESIHQLFPEDPDAERDLVPTKIVWKIDETPGTSDGRCQTKSKKDGRKTLKLSKGKKGPGSKVGFAGSPSAARPRQGTSHETIKNKRRMDGSQGIGNGNGDGSLVCPADKRTGAPQPQRKRGQVDTSDLPACPPKKVRGHEENIRKVNRKPQPKKVPISDTPHSPRLRERKARQLQANRDANSVITPEPSSSIQKELENVANPPSLLGGEQQAGPSGVRSTAPMECVVETPGLLAGEGQAGTSGVRSTTPMEYVQERHGQLTGEQQAGPSGVRSTAPIEHVTGRPGTLAGAEQFAVPSAPQYHDVNTPGTSSASNEETGDPEATAFLRLWRHFSGKK